MSLHCTIITLIALSLPSTQSPTFSSFAAHHQFYIIIIFQSSTRTLERTGPCCPFVIDNNNFHIFSRVALGPRPRPARPEHKTQSHNFPRRQQQQRQRRGPEKSGQGPSQILCCENCGLFESDTATACDSAASSTDCVCLSCDWWCANVVRLREMSNGTHSQPASQLCTCNSLALLFSLLLFRPYRIDVDGGQDRPASTEAHLLHSTTPAALNNYSSPPCTSLWCSVLCAVCPDAFRSVSVCV